MGERTRAGTMRPGPNERPVGQKTFDANQNDRLFVEVHADSPEPADAIERISRMPENQDHMGG